MISSQTDLRDTPLESVTLKKGLLWQQRDRFFSRWKERFFVLTKDYLACFKKGSKVGISEMGGFLYKVSLVDVEGLQWVDKKHDGVIAIRVGQEGQLLLWSQKGLDDWMFALREAVSRSKGRREALRKSQTLMPQLSDSGIIRRYGLGLQHTLSDSHVQATLVHSGSSVELHSGLGHVMRSLGERYLTPCLTERAKRMSVLTEGDISGDMDFDTSSGSDLYPVTRPSLGPRLAPQCSSGSHSSLVSLGCRSESGHLYKPSPRSLQVSPALTQRSLYAQHILSSPEICQPPEPRQSKTSATSATSEFSFVHPDSPITVSSLRISGSHGSRQSNRPQYQRSHSHSTNLVHPQHQTIGPPGDNSRPCSIYGQPYISVEKSAFSSQPPDVVPSGVVTHTETQSLPKRSVHRYVHSKSESSFMTDKAPIDSSALNLATNTTATASTTATTSSTAAASSSAASTSTLKGSVKPR